MLQDLANITSGPNRGSYTASIQPRRLQHKQTAKRTSQDAGIGGAFVRYESQNCSHLQYGPSLGRNLRDLSAQTFQKLVFVANLGGIRSRHHEISTDTSHSATIPESHGAGKIHESMDRIQCRSTWPTLGVYPPYLYTK